MLGNLKLLRSTARTATIGFEGLHRVTHFGSAGRKQIASDRATRKGDPTTHTEEEGRSAVMPTTTSMAAIVLGNNRLRPFFYFRNPQEIRQLHAIAQAELDRLVRASKA
jgi:hypothetical protein